MSKISVYMTGGIAAYKAVMAVRGLQKAGLGALLHDDEHAAVDHQVYIRAENIDHLHGAVYLHVFRHIDQESVLRQHGVERRNAIVGRSGDLGIILGDKLRHACSKRRAMGSTSSSAASFMRS